MYTNFESEMLSNAFSSTLADLGTSVIGWIVVIISPIISIVLLARTAPSGQRWARIRSKWISEFRDTVFIYLAISFALFCWELCWHIPAQIEAASSGLSIPGVVTHLQSDPISDVPAPQGTRVHITHEDGTQTSLSIEAVLVNQTSPSLIVRNSSTKVAKGIVFEVVLYRRSDLRFFSAQTRDIGFVKGDSVSAPYPLIEEGQLWTSSETDVMKSAVGLLAKGDDLTGTLTIDCPDCTGKTYILHLVWKENGWYTSFLGGSGKLALPKSNSDEDIAKYLTELGYLIPIEERVMISKALSSPSH